MTLTIFDISRVLRHVIMNLRERFREGRLAQTAGSLTFTTLISLVPLLTVMLALFTAFPMFSSLQTALEQYFLKSLIPDSISKTVLGTLTQFSAKASRLGTVGLIALGISALMMMFTIDRTLNTIWRVKRPRPIAQRVLVYWAAVTLGPLVLGASLALSSYAISAGKGLVQDMPGNVATLLNLLEVALLAAGVAGLFHYVPNTHVRWRHTLFGGIFVAVAFTLAKSGLTLYVKRVPTYSTLYGAFAAVPIFLIWLYLGWIIVLVGAVLAASAPSIFQGLRPQLDTPGNAMALAIDVLRTLAQSRDNGEPGITKLDIARRLRIDPLELEPVVDQLVIMDWLGRLDEEGAQRLTLLCDPAQTLAEPLIKSFLAEERRALLPLWERSGWRTAHLSELLTSPAS